MSMNTPKEIIHNNMKGAVTKANLSLPKMITLGMLAGMFIAIGGVTSNTATHGIPDIGLAKTLSGCIFPIGLLMIVLVGGELFTGNCLMVMATIDKRISKSLFIRNLIVVLLSNLVGSLLIDVLVFFSGNLDMNQGLLGAYTIKVAIAKVNIPPFQAFISGMLCNFLVCVAILKGSAAREVSGKIMATWFPIFAFVICGFEHVVANMYYIPLGIMAKTRPEYVEKAKEIYSLTTEQFATLNIEGAFRNFIPVTLGNMIGGMLIGLLLYTINFRLTDEE